MHRKYNTSIRYLDILFGPNPINFLKHLTPTSYIVTPVVSMLLTELILCLCYPYLGNLGAIGIKKFQRNYIDVLIYVLVYS